MGKQTKEKAFSTINLRSFIVIAVILFVILVAVGVLTYVVPKGEYLLDEKGNIIAGSFHYLDVNGGVPIWKIILAPIMVFASDNGLTIIMISLFLLVMSGCFNVMEKTGGLKALIRRAIKAFSKKKTLVIMIAVLFFMAFGSFFGMFEELVTLLPIVVVLMLSLGFDSMIGLGVCMLSACFGFSSAITNPFSVGLASQMAGVAVFDGVWLRIIFFVCVYALVCAFILGYAKKITKDKTKSLTFDIDREKLENIDFNLDKDVKDGKAFKAYAIFLSIAFVILILIASVRVISGYAIPILAVVFLVGGIVCGLIVSESKKKVFVNFLSGMFSMLPAVFLIALASSVKYVLDEGLIIGTITNNVVNFLSGKSKFLCVLLIYLLILILQVFIGSASAKIMLIMPIIVPICAELGISPSVVILTYCMADGFTDMILPTNPVLLIGLSMANVSYGKWVKWTYKMQITVFILTLLFLFFATGIGY
ncbi:MAG: YfcC family protein [Clostridiales bacterium]|nr:YfcC family protein [Clostridiales bacterium]